MKRDSQAYHKLAPVFLKYLGTIYYMEQHDADLVDLVPDNVFEVTSFLFLLQAS